MAKDLGTDGFENQVKGAAKEVGGKIRKNVGDITDNHSEEIKGAAKEMEGKAQRKVGEAESKIDRNT
ncbi:MAG: CsbD family protein [Gemmatimonadaceae bacterium]